MSDLLHIRFVPSLSIGYKDLPLCLKEQVKIEFTKQTENWILND